MPPSSNRLGQILATAVLPVVALVILVLLSALPNASTLFFTWPWAFYGQLLLLVPVFLLGWWLIKRPAVWRREWTVLGFTALAIGISVIFSRRPAFSLEVGLFLCCGLAWCGVVAVEASNPDALHLRSPSELQRFVRIAGVLLALPLIAGLFYWFHEVWTSAHLFGVGRSALFRAFFSIRNQHPLGHWNYTGGFAVIALPWFAALILFERGKWRAMWIGCALVGSVMLFTSYSRGAILAVMTAVAAPVAVSLFKGRISRKRASMLAIAAIVVAGGLWATNARLRAVIAHPASILQPSEGDVQRLGMLQGGWLLAQQRPWIGHGPGMTPFIFPEVRAHLDGGVETVFQLHNGPLQLWVDHGLLGLLCATALAAVLFFNALRWLKSPPGDLRTFALASAYSLVGYFVMFATDYQLNVLAFVAVLGLQAGLVLAAPGEREPIAPLFARGAGGVLLVAGAAILIILIPAWRARQSFWNAWATDIPAENIARLERAVELAPRNPYYLNQLALRRARLAETAAKPTVAASLRTRARDELAHSLVLDPAQEPVQAALGWLWLTEDPKQAENHFHAAVALLPDRDTVHFGLALSRLAQGDRPGAARELSLECLANPLFIASPLWAQEPLLPLRSDTIGQLFKDYIFVIQYPDTPAWRKPQLIYAAAFMRWWLGGLSPNAAELKGALPHQQQFFEHLSAPDKILPSEHSFWWNLLDRARQDAAHADTILRSSATPPANEAIAGTLARLAGRPADLSQLLRSASPGGIGIVRQNITRGHYAIMNNVLDGPGYEDLAPRFFDAFTTEYAGPLFPPRNSIPGPAMLDLIRQ
jgi:O-antigen ligase